MGLTYLQNLCSGDLAENILSAKREAEKDLIWLNKIADLISEGIDDYEELEKRVGHYPKN